MNTTHNPPPCATCRFYYRDRQHCTHEEAMKFDPINGRETTWVRVMRPNGACGYEGKLWEEIPPTPRSVIARRWAFVGVGIAILIWLFSS